MRQARCDLPTCYLFLIEAFIFISTVIVIEKRMSMRLRVNHLFIIDKLICRGCRRYLIMS